MNYTSNFSKYLKEFTLEKLVSFEHHQTTIERYSLDDNKYIPRYINEFWTSKQRQSNPLHEISYRACFKAELPRFFIKQLSQGGDTIYDPFSGRGTSIIEAAILGRNVISNDINPLSKILCKPRLNIPTLDNIKERLSIIKINNLIKNDIDLSMFYHPKTLKEILSIRKYLIDKNNINKEDHIDDWIRMIVTNRLTGHSNGFLSVYTLPPNQAISQEGQIKINKKKKQFPLYRNINEIIIKKSISLTKKIDNDYFSLNSEFYNDDARNTQYISSESIQLTITSPPFLDIVQYGKDNWLRCWFNDIDHHKVSNRITMVNNIKDWCEIMMDVFHELYRITRKSGYVAFEVGEIKAGTIKLDEYIVPIGIKAGFNCIGIIINKQNFNKTSNIWGIKNNNKGTNTNRIVLFEK